MFIHNGYIAIQQTTNTMRGSKTCPNCKNTMGPRTKICACGHDFNIQSKTAKFKDAEIKPKVKNEITLELNAAPVANVHTVIVPAGKCPVTLDKGIEYFVEGIHSHAATKGVKYLPSVYEYWAGTIIDKFSDEGKETIRKIKDYVIHKGI